MNYATLYGHQVQPNSSGTLAIANREAYFWQSRLTTACRGPAPLPQLVNLRELAQEVREFFHLQKDTGHAR